MKHRDPYVHLRPPQATPADGFCDCHGDRPIKLMSALEYNPIYCVHCNRPIQPESLALDGALVRAIARWRSTYDAIDRLWLDSGPYESWARKQLADMQSSVNRQGMTVCHKLNLAHRCYYWYFQDRSLESVDLETHCPVCQEPFEVYDGGMARQLVCDTCSIITRGE